MSHLEYTVTMQHVTIVSHVTRDVTEFNKRTYRLSAAVGSPEAGGSLRSLSPWYPWRCDTWQSLHGSWEGFTFTDSHQQHNHLTVTENIFYFVRFFKFLNRIKHYNSPAAVSTMYSRNSLKWCASQVALHPRNQISSVITVHDFVTEFPDSPGRKL